MSSYNNKYDSIIYLSYILITLYTHSKKLPHLFIYNQHPLLPHYIVRRNIDYTYPSPNNNVLPLYLYKPSIRQPNTYLHIFFYIFQTLTPVRNTLILNCIITHISPLYSYYYITL